MTLPNLHPSSMRKASSEELDIKRLKASNHSFMVTCKGIFKGGGGVRGFKPPPPKFSDFFEK